MFNKIMGQRVLSLMLVTIMVTGLFPPMTMPVQAEGEVYGVLQSNGSVCVTDVGKRMTVPDINL